VQNRLQNVLPVVIDIAAGLLLLVIGAFLGSLLAGKSTREVWNEAGSSVKVPSTDLLMWLAPPVLLLLIYALLISRGLSLGARLKRSQQ
jgi:MFS-type transporter involved in bile tolerance (Atg22 family)